MGKHADLVARHRRVMPDWVPLYYDEPIALVSGDGRRVTDAEGNSYLDFLSGLLVTSVGHSVPEVVEAIQAQASKIIHTSTSYLIEPMIELAERLVELCPIPDAKVYFVPSGSEAIELALLHACRARNSNQILTFRGAYHGHTFGANAVTGVKVWKKSSLSPINAIHLLQADRSAARFKGWSDQAIIDYCVEDLRDVLNTSTTGNVAALIVEPVQGLGGFLAPPDGLFGAMKEVLDEHGILLITDEIQTGFGRTGENFWGIDAHGVTPDLMTVAKGMGNGITIGAVIGRPELMDGLEGYGASTYGGNHLSTATALAVIDYIIDHDLQGNAKDVGDHLRRRLHKLAETCPLIGDIRGKGLQVGVEIVDPATGQADPVTAERLQEYVKRGGLLVGRAGVHLNVFRMAPPLSVTREEADEAFDILVGAIEQVTTGAKVGAS